MARRANRPDGAIDGSFAERCRILSDAKRKQAMSLPAGSERDSLLREARTIETTAHFDNWIASPGRRPPI